MDEFEGMEGMEGLEDIESLDGISLEFELLRAELDLVALSLKDVGDQAKSNSKEFKSYKKSLDELNKSLEDYVKISEKAGKVKFAKPEKTAETKTTEKKSSKKTKDVRTDAEKEADKLKKEEENEKAKRQKMISNAANTLSTDFQRIYSTLVKGNKVTVKELGSLAVSGTKASMQLTKGAKGISQTSGAIASLGSTATKVTGIVGLLVTAIGLMAEAGKYAYQKNLDVNRSLMQMGASSNELKKSTVDTANKMIDIKNTWTRIGEDLAQAFEPVFRLVIEFLDMVGDAVETVTDGLGELGDTQKKYSTTDSKARWYTKTLEERAGEPESKSLPVIGDIASSAKQSGFSNQSAANLAIGTYDAAMKLAREYGQEASEVAKKLADAWIDGSDAAKQYGVVVDDQVLAGFMAEKGVDIVNVKITDAMKQYYRYQLLLEQSSASNSDAMQDQIKEWKQLGMQIETAKGKLFSFDEVINLEALDTRIPDVEAPKVEYPEAEEVEKKPETLVGPVVDTSGVDGLLDAVTKLTEAINQMNESTAQTNTNVAEMTNNISQVNENINNTVNNVTNMNTNLAQSSTDLSVIEMLLNAIAMGVSTLVGTITETNAQVDAGLEGINTKLSITDTFLNALSMGFTLLSEVMLNSNMQTNATSETVGRMAEILTYGAESCTNMTTQLLATAAGAEGLNTSIQGVNTSTETNIANNNNLVTALNNVRTAMTNASTTERGFSSDVNKNTSDLNNNRTALSRTGTQSRTFGNEVNNTKAKVIDFQSAAKGMRAGLDNIGAGADNTKTKISSLASAIQRLQSATGIKLAGTINISGNAGVETKSSSSATTNTQTSTSASTNVAGVGADFLFELGDWVNNMRLMNEEMGNIKSGFEVFKDSLITFPQVLLAGSINTGTTMSDILIDSIEKDGLILGTIEGILKDIGFALTEGIGDVLSTIDLGASLFGADWDLSSFSDKLMDKIVGDSRGASARSDWRPDWLEDLDNKLTVLLGGEAHYASGGIGTKEIHNATLFEGNKKEAVIPLETNQGIQFMSNALEQAGLNSGGGSNIEVYLTLEGIFDTDDRGKWERLAERLAETIDVQSQRRGSLGYGADY